MKNYMLDLPYFKKGDDMNHCLMQTKTVSEAFLMQAELLDQAASMCRRMAEVQDLEVDADCHHIGISGPKEILDALVTDGLLSVQEWEDEGDPCEEDTRGECLSAEGSESLS